MAFLMHCRSTWHVASQRLRASKFRHSTILMGLEHQRLMFGRCARPIFAASGPVERRGSWASDSHLPRISLQPQTPTNKLQTDVCLAQSPILEIVEEGSSRTTFLCPRRARPPLATHFIQLLPYPTTDLATLFSRRIPHTLHLNISAACWFSINHGCARDRNPQYGPAGRPVHHSHLA